MKATHWLRKINLVGGASYTKIACGFNGATYRTEKLSEVDCMRCKSTGAYKFAKQYRGKENEQ